MAIAASSAACRSRCTIWVLTGSTWRLKRGEHLRLDLGAEMAVRPDRAGDLARADLVDRGGEPGPSAIDLERPPGELVAERGRLGVDRVGAAHHHGLRLGAGPGHDRRGQPVGIVEQPPARGLAAGGRDRCPRRRCWSGRGAGTDPSAPTVSATWLTKAMTSWSVVRSISAIRSTSTRARVSSGSERLGGDEAATGLRAGDRELDPEHRLEPRLVRPDRAHLGERVAADHRAAPASEVPAWQRHPSRRCRGDAAGPPSGRRPRPFRLVARRRSGPARVRPRRARARRRSGSCRRRRRRSRHGRPGRPSRRPRRGPRSHRHGAARPGSPPPRGRSRPWHPGAPGGARPPDRAPARRGPGRHARPRAAAARGPRPAAAGPPASRDRRTGRCTRAGPGRRRSASARRRARHGTGSRVGPARRGSGGGTPRPAPGSRRPGGPRAGCTPPCPRCSGRDRRRPSRLWSRESGSARASRPSHRAIRLASRPWSRSSTTTRSPGASRALAIAASASARSSQTVTPLPAARPSALTTTPAPSGVERPRERQRRLHVLERVRARHADAGRGGDLVAERLAALDPCGGGRRTEDRDPGGDERIGDPGRERRLRSDDDELGRLAPSERDHGGPVERIDVGAAHPRLACDRVAPRGDDHLVDARLRAELPGQRMLATAAPHDEDPGRHQQARSVAHAGIPARFRIGRQARSIVCVRSGPTDSSTIGTPACASMALT